MGATVLDTFITRFGYKTDTSELSKASKGMTDLKTQAIKIAGVVGAVLGGGFLINKIADASDETLKFADSVGVAVEELSALEFAAQRQGGSIGGLRSSLEKINKVIGEVSRGQGRAKLAFEDYGLTVEKTNGELKTADELFVELNKKFSDLSRVQQFDLSAKLGIDPKTIRVLQTAPDTLKQLTSEAKAFGVLTRKDAETAAEFNDRLTDLNQVMKNVGQVIGAKVMRPLIQFFEVVAKGLQILRENNRFVKVLLAILGSLAAAWAFVARKAILANLAMLAIPIGIALLILAIAALAEDFYAFFTGAPSVIGDLVEKWPTLGAAILAIRDTIVIVAKSFAQSFSIMWDWLGKIGNGLMAMPSNISRSFKAVSEFIHSFLIDPLQTVVELFNSIKQKLTGPLASLAQKLGIDFGQDMATAPATSPAAGGTLNNDNRQNSIRIDKVEIMAPNGDSKEIGQNLNTELRNQMQHAVRDFDSTVRR